MNAVFSILLLAAILGFIVFLLSKKDQNRRSQYGPSGLSEFRTDLPLDDCFDRLDPHSPDDVFAYECRRENLIFIREAFGYKEPLFQPAMLDEFMLRKFDARRTK